MAEIIIMSNAVVYFSDTLPSNTPIRLLKSFNKVIIGFESKH